MSFQDPASNIPVQRHQLAIDGDGRPNLRRSNAILQVFEEGGVADWNKKRAVIHGLLIVELLLPQMPCVERCWMRLESDSGNTQRTVRCAA